MSADMLEEELKACTVFRDETKLSVFYVPDNMPHRENEIKQLANIFRPLLEYPGGTSRIVFISGSVGTGKTAVAKRFGALIEAAAKRRCINLKYIHVNCRREKTNFLILLQLAHAISPNIPSRGYSPTELLKIVTGLLDEKNLFILLALDEADFLINQGGGDLIYDLTRLNDDKLNKTHRLSLILISKDETVKSMLDDSVTSIVAVNNIKFAPYTAHQLEDILGQRAREAFYQSSIAPGVIGLIADVAAEWGDARYALELFWRAAKYADEEGTMKVFPEHVRRAKADTHPELRRETLANLNKHDKIILLSIVRNLAKGRKAYTTMGDVEETYHLICEEYRQEPRAHTQLWDRVRSLNINGVITTKISGKGVRGKTTLIGVGEAPAEILEAELVREMEVRKNEDRQ